MKKITIVINNLSPTTILFNKKKKIVISDIQKFFKLFMYL